MRRTRCFAFLAAALIASTCATLPASAQSEAESRISGLRLNGGDPIQIESDKLEVREEDNLAIFTGNVTVTQGPTLLKAGRMTVYYAKDGGSAATGSSNIEQLEVDDKVYVKSDNQVATGDSGIFDMKTEVLVLSGKQGRAVGRHQRADRLQAHRADEDRAGPGRRLLGNARPDEDRSRVHQELMENEPSFMSRLFGGRRAGSACDSPQ